MSQKNTETIDSYVIPPNFIDTGTFFGGMFKARNTIEAGIILLAVGLPVLKLPFALTTRIIVLCLTALPLGLLALIGVSGESLSSFIVNFFKFLYNRRVVGSSDELSAVRMSCRQTKRKSDFLTKIRIGKSQPILKESPANGRTHLPRVFKRRLNIFPLRKSATVLFSPAITAASRF